MNLLISKFETFLYYLFLLITTLSFPLIFFFIKFINIFCKVRFTEILYNRYGHLALNPEYCVVEKKESKTNSFFLDIFAFVFL